MISSKYSYLNNESTIYSALSPDFNTTDLNNGYSTPPSKNPMKYKNRKTNINNIAYTGTQHTIHP